MQHLTDAELHRAWEHTSLTLDRTRNPARRLSIVITRQHLLDEIWSRDRDALDGWVARGAPAHDGTDRYIDP